MILSLSWSGSDLEKCQVRGWEKGEEGHTPSVKLCLAGLGSIETQAEHPGTVASDLNVSKRPRYRGVSLRQAACSHALFMQR